MSLAGAGLTVTVTVADAVTPAGSAMVYVKLSVPVNPAVEVYRMLLFVGSTWTTPWAGVDIPTMVNGALSGSVSLARTGMLTDWPEEWSPGRCWPPARDR